MTSEMIDNSLPNPNQRAIRFWDKMANRYTKKPVADEQTYQRKLEISRSYFQPNMSNVLEIGCGSGSTAISHAPYVQHIHATDISTRMIEIAKLKAQQQSVDNITFEQVSTEDISYPNDSQDAVLALSVLHLLSDKEALVEKVYNMLKPNGVFITSTPCIADMSSLLGTILPIANFLRVIPPLSIFNLSELENCLTRSGFTIEKQWLPGPKASVFIVARKP